MPKDDINYKFTENGLVYDFYDVFVPAENFRQPALWVWGASSSLGNNNATDAPTPITTFAGGTNWKSVSAGGNFTAAVKTDGTLWNWGAANLGQLGTNDNTPTRVTPVTTFAGGTNWKQVSCGYQHTAAVKTDGTLWTWGFSGQGRLGNNFPFGSVNVPSLTFAGGTDWKQVSCGEGHTAAIKTDGSLWVWGYNNTAQLGVNDTTDRNIPVTTFAGGTTWKQVACGGNHTAAIKTDGTLWSWGVGTDGRLGTNDTTTRSTPVTTFAGGTDWKQVVCGRYHTAAIKTDGSLWIWGKNQYGALGVSDENNRSTPVTTFAGGNNWKQVSCGNELNAAIKTDGTLWVWGVVWTNGRLGINVTGFGVFRNTPVTTFAGGNNWKQVFAGNTHMGAIKYQPDP